MYTTFKNRMQLIHILTTLNILWQQNSCLTSVFTAGIARISTSRKIAVPCCTSRSSRTISVVPPRVMMYLGFTAAAFTVTVTIWILGLLPSPHLSNRHHPALSEALHTYMFWFSWQCVHWCTTQQWCSQVKILRSSQPKASTSRPSQRPGAQFSKIPKIC